MVASRRLRGLAVSTRRGLAVACRRRSVVRLVCRGLAVCRRRFVVGRRGVVVGGGRLAVSRLVVRRLADGAGRLVRVRVRLRVRLRVRVSVAPPSSARSLRGTRRAGRCPG